MKRTLSKRLKKSVSAILAAAMSLSLFTAIPVSADIGRTTYNYDGYSVDYNITNEWDGAQTVELTVSNTGTDSILNWALKYDAEGEISNLWNADLYERNGDEYVIKNVGWNFEIAPRQSITYGYTLSGNGLPLPENFEIYSKRVDKAEGYDVQYNITKSWDTGVEGNIVIANISPVPIEAWTLSFDSNFTVDNFWNGRVLENNGTSYTVAAEMWTNPVQPNGSMTIGFVGSKAADVEALLSNFKLTEVVIGEGMPVIPIDPPVEEIEIMANAVYDEENNNITVSWNTNNPNGTFDVLMSNDGENFVSVGIVEGVSEFVYAPENDFETLYFKVVHTAGEQTAESNVVAVAKSAEDIAISAEASYDKESGKIIVSWTSNKENGTFEVLVSEDGENFTSIDTVEDVTEFVYSPNSEFDVLYFKVKQTIGELSAESNVAIVDYQINWADKTDTDNDRLPDVYEKYYFETDPTNPDTDGDGLLDGYEVYYLGTDPKKADSNENGVSDGDEDFDGDGLSNKREYELGTDPNNADTDSDGLIDSEEVNTYNTDPLKFDTDEDGISDSDEVALGLNPTNAATDGTPDSERAFMQHVGADSENFAAVNTSENPFEVSIDITAAGVASNNLYSMKSGYSNAIKNDAILGITPEFIYTDGLKVEDVIINFTIDNSAVNNCNNKYTAVSDEFVGIKRLNVFKFFEDANMLLPIETFHDVENNRVYTHVDELGTYCLMDMELWLEGLEIEPNDNFDDNVEPMFFGARTAAEEEKNIDVVFILYNSKGLLNSVKAEMKTTSENIFKQAKSENANVRMYFVSFLGKSIESADGKIYVESYEEAEQIINNYGGGVTAALDEKNYALYKALNYTANNYVPQFRDNSDRYCFVIDACVYPKVDSGIGAIDTFNKNNVRLCFSYSPNNSNALNYSLLSTGACEEAIIGNGRYNFGDFVIKEIFGEHENEYPIISAVGWKRINLDEPITEEYRNYSLVIANDPSLRYDIIKKYDLADTDGDELYDFEEIMFETKDGNDLIAFDASGNAVLPNFEDCTGALPWNRRIFYVEEGLRRYADVAKFQDLYKLRILPIKSDPTSDDSDGDGIDDEEETFIGTSCLSSDTDRDGLDDCTEYINWFDPLDPNPDGDIYNDYEEFINGTNPYAVDFTAEAWAAEFIKGVIEGDIIEEPSIPALFGQIAGGMAPVVGTVADVRDTIVNVARGDWGMAVLSFVGIAPVAGDISKAAANITQFIVKNSDNASRIAELIITFSKKSSGVISKTRVEISVYDFIKKIPISSYDELVEILRKSNIKITREGYLQLIEFFEKEGRKFPTIIDDLPEAKIVFTTDNVWSKSYKERGFAVDDLFGNNLGRTYKTYDSVIKGTGIVTSVKSLDPMCASYRTTSKFRGKLNQYVRDLLNGANKVSYKEGGQIVEEDVTKKILNIVFPDVPLTSGQKDVINELKERANSNNFEVVISIVKTQ